MKFVVLLLLLLTQNVFAKECIPYLIRHNANSSMANRHYYLGKDCVKTKDNLKKIAKQLVSDMPHKSLIVNLYDSESAINKSLDLSPEMASNYMRSLDFRNHYLAQYQIFDDGSGDYFQYYPAKQKSW